jgi:SAM-dependent methyltransferase
MKETREEEWFAKWFNTPEYHTLYGNRDEEEARTFISVLDTLIGFKEANILDAGCGAGRHVHAWALLGYNATGFDLSPNSIEYASSRSAELKVSGNTKFRVADLRKLKDIAEWTEEFDIVTSLFTSFGYFTQDQDHFDVALGFSRALKKGGRLVFDYLNTPYSLMKMVSEEITIKGGCTFEIKRQLKDGFFKKTIFFTDSSAKPSTHTELVKAWSVDELTELFSSVGLHVKSIYGDYQLSNFDENSPRLIIIAEKV